MHKWYSLIDKVYSLENLSESFNRIRKNKGLHKQLERMGYTVNFEKSSVTRWRNSGCKLAHMAMPNSYFDEVLLLFNMEEVKTDTLY